MGKKLDITIMMKGWTYCFLGHLCLLFQKERDFNVGCLLKISLKWIPVILKSSLIKDYGLTFF